MALPFLKWAGGKRRLLPQLEPLLPSDLEDREYCEPFVGGGAVFFSLANRLKGTPLLGDMNPRLMQTYRDVRDRLPQVLHNLRPLVAQVSAEDFYRIRNRFNVGLGSSAQLTAMFIYLNKLCFNGLYRVNRKGDFNVPYGRYKRPRILDVPTIRAASAALQPVMLVGCPRGSDFARTTQFLSKRAFIYVDPPYDPVSTSANFTSYTHRGFDEATQARLARCLHNWSLSGHKVMISQSDTPLIRELYEGFDITTISAPRSVAADGSKRQAVGELVIRNYDV